MKILKWIGAALGVAVILLGAIYALRTDPWSFIPGKRLSGEEQPYPPDWSICNDHLTIAVETRPEDPYSVTVSCILHEGDLVFASIPGSTQEWAASIARDPRIRIKIGDGVYPVRGERALDLTLDDIMPSLRAKYPGIAESTAENPPEDIWFFRVRQR